MKKEVLKSKNLEEKREEKTEEYTTDAKSLFGFWVYILSDCILFASLFAAYIVLRSSTFDGPVGRDFFAMPFVLGETMFLLTSSFTYGLVSIYAHHHNSKKKVLTWLLVTFALGVGFVSMELAEFTKLLVEGDGPEKSAFLSAFFTLLGTHGLHVTIGLLWMVIVFINVAKKDISPHTLRIISLLGLFWHFLDIVWIFIFTVVYLLGVI